jgi:hypothetical protein
MNFSIRTRAHRAATALPHSEERSAGAFRDLPQAGCRRSALNIWARERGIGGDGIAPKATGDAEKGFRKTSLNSAR